MKIYFTNAGFHKRALKHILELALAHLSQPSAQLEVSVAIVSPEQIRYYNNKYRQVDAVTDVLSFPTADLGKKVVDISALPEHDVSQDTERFNLGDILICSERAREQATEYGHGMKREMCFLALHGLLHLLGYDHMNPADEAEMTALQEEILQQAGITR